jgi:hypothetical protein
LRDNRHCFADIPPDIAPPPVREDKTTQAGHAPDGADGGEKAGVATEAGMSGAFEQREDTFEKQFARDEALRFRAVARRNKAVALWVGEMTGLAPEAAETYAEAFVSAQVGASDDDVVAALEQDLARAKVDLSDHRLRRRMSEAMAESIAAVKAGK